MKKTPLLAIALLCWSTVCAAQTQSVGYAPMPDAQAVPGHGGVFAPSSATGYQYAPDAAEPPHPVDDDQLPESGSAWILRAGVVAGEGFASSDCHGSACGPKVADVNYRENVGPYLSLDYLVHSSERFRFGGGVNVIPERELLDDDGDRTHLGTQTGLSLLVEPVLPVSPSVSIAFRGQLGVSLLWPGKEIKDAASNNQDLCDEYASELSDCEADSAPFGGGELAAGLGMLFEVGETTWRVDGQAQAYIIRTLGMEATGPGFTVSTDVTFQGVRGLLTVGVEL